MTSSDKDGAQTTLLELQKAPVASAGMLIRKPVKEVFQAFVDPRITTKFWFTKSSVPTIGDQASDDKEDDARGRLAPFKKVIWTWEMFNHSVEVNVRAIETNKRILVEWGNYSTPSIVEWTFEPRSETTTFVNIINSGFKGSGDQIVDQAISSTGRFSWVLAGAKAWLEHNLALNLIADRFPDNVVK